MLKRATIEFNFHLLYSNFLDVLKLPELSRMVVRETYRNIRVLLRSDKGIANFSDRSLLKNLGHWLGMLTLAKNKPILMIDIDLKSLIIEAYAKGQQELLYVIPFIAKVTPFSGSFFSSLFFIYLDSERQKVSCKNAEIFCRTPCCCNMKTHLILRKNKYFLLLLEIPPEILGCSFSLCFHS